jgi:hypothetical protein
MLPECRRSPARRPPAILATPKRPVNVRSTSWSTAQLRFTLQEKCSNQELNIFLGDSSAMRLRRFPGKAPGLAKRKRRQSMSITSGHGAIHTRAVERQPLAVRVPTAAGLLVFVEEATRLGHNA